MTIVLYLLAAVVAGAAGVSSFDALTQLGVLCGLAHPELLAVAVDAGAVSGAVAWLFARARPARTFGRGMTLALLVVSIAGNAAVHLVDGPAAPVWVAVAVSAVPPSVLGSVVHLVLLVVGPPRRTGGRRPAKQQTTATTTDLRPRIEQREARAA